MLPKGATFTVRIEHITDADGETLGYGEIKSVQLDAGSQGRFEVARTLTPFSGIYKAPASSQIGADE
jgi:hypothetical protein|tara:strand:+ start:952 stop:1152 length:201 start_codon:yes stop_codon:yes gene_type:complete